MLQHNILFDSLHQLLHYNVTLKIEGGGCKMKRQHDEKSNLMSNNAGTNKKDLCIKGAALVSLSLVTAGIVLLAFSSVSSKNHTLLSVAFLATGVFLGICSIAMYACSTNNEIKNTRWKFFPACCSLDTTTNTENLNSTDKGPVLRFVT